MIQRSNHSASKPVKSAGSRIGRRAALGLALAGLLAKPGTGWAQAWPQRPIRVIVPYPAGGSTDIVGRLFAQRLSVRLGVSVVVDNRGGASGTIGSDAVAKSPPDGLTLLFTSGGPLAVAPSLLRAIPYDAAADFEAVTLVAQAPSLLVVPAASPIRDVGALIAEGKARPGTLTVGSPGAGTSVHLIGEMFRLQAGIDVQAVTYRGGGPALQDLLGGRLSYMFENLPQLLPHVRSGALRALAISSARRSAAAPDVATLDESGLPGFEGTTWFGLLAPRGLPRAVSERLALEIAAITAEPDAARLLAEQGTDVDLRAGPAFANFMEADRMRWREVIRRAGIEPI